MRKIKTLIAAAVFVILGANAFAADATVTFVSGKVEVQRGKSWVALNKGDTLSKSDMISTGFQSEAKIKLMDSVLYLGPVTRITLEELSSTGNKDNVNVYLKTGTVRSQVKHVDNKRVDYKVHTAIAVASCRGTDWVIDDSNNVNCFEGMVAVAAYKTPDVALGSKAESAEETESSGEAESSASESDNSTVGAAEEPAAQGKPTSEDGVLVQASQSVKVSETCSVSVPVSAAVKSAAEITSAVSTAASKEAVSSGSAAASATTTTVAAPVNNVPEVPKTGDVIIIPIFE